MEGFKYVDIFATKGVEYLVAITFLIMLIYFWRWLNQSSKKDAVQAVPHTNRVSLVDWFKMDESLYYHQGHSWARPEKNGIIRVGIDDFSQKLLGKPAKLSLPSVGTALQQGENGFIIQIDGKEIDMLSPVSGEVVAVNDKVIQTPDLLNKNPYDAGWLLEVKSEKTESNLKNLLKGKIAHAWIEDTVDKLSRHISGNYGVVLQDGGTITNGFIKELAPDNWEQVAGEFFLTNDR